MPPPQHRTIVLEHYAANGSTIEDLGDAEQIIVVAVPGNNINYCRPVFPDLPKAAKSVRAGSVIHLVSPELKA